MKKIVVTAILAVMFATVGGMAGAKADPGPNGSNDHGLCTAYFNGQKKGHDKHGSPGPFAALEEYAAAYTESDGQDNDGDGDVDEEGESDSLTPAENVFNYCDDNGLIGGNPEHGRYTCTQTNVAPAEGETDPECTENEDPGSGNSSASKKG